jgi:hypothetical protein
MEEKKTKMMTKAEAFEYLKGKKVDTNGRDEAVQMKLFECGICWGSGDFTYQKTNSGKLLITSYGRFFHCGGGDLPNYWEEHPFEKISVDDILSIEIVEDKYELEFSYDKVVELAKPLMAYLNEVGFRDSIRINQLGIAHEPMSTLIFDNGIGE